VRGALRLAGKLASRGVINAVRPGSSSTVAGSWLFFIMDQSSHQRFLVDTGSSFSILPHRSSAPATGTALWSANNTRIRCWGQKTAAITVNGQPLQYQFLLTNVRFPILGIDFMRHFKLVVDVCAEQLLPLTALA
jgi:hypothetical protein